MMSGTASSDSPILGNAVSGLVLQRDPLLAVAHPVQIRSWRSRKIGKPIEFHFAKLSVTQLSVGWIAWFDIQTEYGLNETEPLAACAADSWNNARRLPHSVDPRIVVRFEVTGFTLL